MHRLSKPVWKLSPEAGDGTDGGGSGGSGGGSGAGQGDGSDKTYSQADVAAEVDKIAARIRSEERKKVAEKYADYDDLKKAAEGKKTADDRIAELEGKYAASEAKALRADIANQYGISAEDRDLFLTGADVDALTAQAKRLSEHNAEQKKRGNRVPREGNTPTDTKKRSSWSDVLARLGES